ncbi:MAG: LPS export ABC transporter permease LptG [Wenzhouxiangellaceae bacterium]|nr:LPS export ABC transporter permease LptG [Wenzhouxiangellaceae bacterium]
MVTGGLLGHYVGGAVARSTLAVALVLVGFYLSVELVREAGDLGGGYGIVEMLMYLLRTAPARLYDLFPFAILIGSMVALGRLAAQQELVAMRACGFHRQRIIVRVLGVALLLGLGMMLLGEWVVPKLELQARIERERARTGQVALTAGQGLWVRDGPLMIEAGLLAWEEEGRVRFADLRIYEMGDENEIRHLVFADSAHHSEAGWRLQSVRRLDPQSGRLDPERDVLTLESRLSPDVFNALATRPRLMPIRDIQRIRGYLEANGQDAGAYVQALWRRLLYPVNALAMLFSGIILLFRPGRQIAPMASVFAGVSVGLMFFIFHRLVLGLAPVLPLPVGITQLLPAALFGAAGWWLLRSR